MPLGTAIMENGQTPEYGNAMKKQCQKNNKEVVN